MIERRQGVLDPHRRLLATQFGIIIRTAVAAVWNAIAALNGAQLDGRRFTVNEARAAGTRRISQQRRPIPRRARDRGGRDRADWSDCTFAVLLGLVRVCSPLEFSTGGTPAPRSP